MKTRTLSLLVDNSTGVLSRIAGLFSRRAYNIDSLTVGATADPKYSRMTVVASGDDQVLEQITKQLKKLVDVRDIKVLTAENSVQRELMLVKVKAGAAERQGVISIVNIFRGSIIDISAGSLTVEAIGARSKLEAFLEMLKDYEVLELARTGVTGLTRGTDQVTYLD
ncbi:MAG: acetolactate synthase small subunit [Eubacterium sp.]|nr:acetolactate synthase small subunit [Eubacterium sp.]